MWFTFTPESHRVLASQSKGPMSPREGGAGATTRLVTTVPSSFLFFLMTSLFVLRPFYVQFDILSDAMIRRGLACPELFNCVS